MTNDEDACLLIAVDGALLATNDAARPLLDRLMPLLPDLIRLDPGAAIYLDGRKYAACRTLLQMVSETASVFVVTLRASDSDERRPLPLSDMAFSFTSSLDIEQVLEQVVRFAMDLLDADAGSLPLYDAELDRLLPGHLVNLPVDIIGPITSRQQGLMWQMIDQQQPLLIADYPAHPAALPSLVQVGVRSLIAIPIVHDLRPLGILALYRMRNKPFHERDRETLQAIARQTAIALQNAHLYQAAVRNADERYALYRASIEISATLDLEYLYQTIHRAVARLAPCASFTLALLNDHQVEYVYRVTAAGRQPVQQASLSHGLAGYVLRFGVSLRLSGEQALPVPAVELLPEIEGDLRAGSLLATPLIVSDRIIGALLVWSDRHDAYSARDLSALEMLAATVAVAVHNALRFAQMQSLAVTDALTDLFNRRHFHHLLQHEIERARRYHTPLSLALIDVDHFKLVNDQFGHDGGDQVLREITQRCRKMLRDVDTLARYGGEEFALLLPETSYDAALAAARRLQQGIASAPFLVDHQPIQITLSIGVAEFHPNYHPDLNTLLADADRALYLAKRQGRNRVCGAKELSSYGKS